MRTDATRIPSALSRFAATVGAAGRRGGRVVMNHPAAAPALCAALAGGALACVWTQWTLRFGGDPAVTFGGRAAVLIGLATAWALGRRRTLSVTATGPVCAAAVALGPLCLAAAEAVATAAPAGWLAGGRGAAWLTLAALAALGPAACGAGLLAFGPGAAGVRLLAAGAGVGLFGTVLAPAIGLQNAALVAAGGAVAAAGLAMLFAAKGDESAAADETLARGPARRVDPLAVGVALLCGAAVAAGLRAAATYFPLTVETLLGRAALAVAGLGLGLLIAGRLRRDRRAAAGGLVAVAGTAAAFAAGDLWLELNLWANATLDAPGLLTDLRILCAAAFLLPACVGAGFAARATAAPAGVGILASGAGLLIGGGALAALPDGGVLVGTLCLLTATTLVAVVRCGSWGVRPRLAVGLAALTAAVCVSGRHEPPTAAVKTLFGALPTIARQGGVTGPALVHLDDARELARIETTRDTATLFREQGTLLTVRHAGLPEAAAALQPTLAPRDSAAVMRAVLPLLWSSSTDRVLLLGTSGPTVAEAVTRFPVRAIVACDARPAAVAAMRDELVRARAVDPFADERVALLPLDPVLAVRGAELRTADRFNVIIADPPHPGAVDAAAEESAAYARRVADLLTPEGVACRRVRTTDCGPGALVAAAATWRTAFAEVRCVEVGRGEFALLGTNAPNGLVDTRLGIRADRPHVRQLMAECGWDWSVPLNLTAVGPNRIADLAGDAAAVTAADGRTAFALPRAMQAWTNKPAEVAAALAPVSGRLLDSAVPTLERPRVDHRLQEVIARRQMHLEYPDRPWVYRKELKKQLTKNVRSVIRQTSAGPKTVRHPEDERRIAFVEALAAATDLSDANLAKLESFAAPYDPMVTPALPGELSRLYALRGDRPAALLRSLLTGVHRAPVGDRGVRTVCDALEALAEHPEIIPDAGERYDTANGLLQVLKQRWELRGQDQAQHGWPTKTGVALHDVSETLDAIEHGFALLEEAAADAGVSDADRETRQAWLSRSLVRPLRGYRAGLQQAQDRRLATAEALAAEAAAYGDSGDDDEDGAEAEDEPAETAAADASVVR
ncbi:hypothetical protein [Alienimonas californiensis]|uniref:Spermidine synthase n=1 Tax=Alienimonas californiensis TaxID=2527989 RepID=A0A517PBW7_9PLAN|nr:hypothetical protein [Alienimonas californiensis]QDT16870.1 hypothetical protein CA12_29780 [Alienimonas californiensis]